MRSPLSLLFSKDCAKLKNDIVETKIYTWLLGQPHAIYSFLFCPRVEDNELWEDIASYPGECLDIWQGQARSKFSSRSELHKLLRSATAPERHLLCKTAGSCTMYQSSLVPWEYYPAMMPPCAYTYPPLQPGRAEDASRSVMFPPIRMHNFYSRPITFVVDRSSYPDYVGGQVEYHHLYGASNPYIHPYHTWHFPPMVPIPLYNPYANYHPYAACRRSDQYRDMWPEGFTMRGELQWGKLGKVFGPKKDLPEFVKDDLRRVYGTYPRTNVSISYRKGEFLVKGDPKIEDQEYTVEKVTQRAVTPSASEADDNSEDRNRKKKKKLRH